MNDRQRKGLTLKPGNYFPLIILMALSLGCRKSNVDKQDLRDFNQVNLVANSREYDPVTVDKTLINAFGIAWSPNGVAWVNSVGGHESQLYSEDAKIVKSVNIPDTAKGPNGLPCGIVFSGGKGFKLRNGPSLFLFTGFDGVLSGWNPALGDTAQFILHPPGSSFTGLAIGASGGQNFIYAANFGQKKIVVWDTTFKRIAMSFTDPTLPDTYSPYNIQAVGDLLFVMYAELETSGKNAGHGIEGPGKGFVSVFRTDGTFVMRFASRGTLDIPWGVTMAPASFLEEQDMINETGGNQNGSNNKNTDGINNFGGNSNRERKDPVILVGNFGDGRINVFSQRGDFIGQLQSKKHPIVIDGLWSLSFAPALATDRGPLRLYFTAGPDHEQDGVFGFLVKQ